MLHQQKVCRRKWLDKKHLMFLRNMQEPIKDFQSLHTLAILKQIKPIRSPLCTLTFSSRLNIFWTPHARSAWIRDGAKLVRC